jgi:hypothetical protein
MNNPAIPEVNVRIAVMDLCEATKQTEKKVLTALCTMLDQDEIRRRNVEPRYLRYKERYRLEYPIAVFFFNGIRDESIKWDHKVNEVEDELHYTTMPHTTEVVIDKFKRWPKVSIPFEQFNFLLRDLKDLLNDIFNFDELGLMDKWRYGVEFNENRVSRYKETQLNSTPQEKSDKNGERVQFILDVISDLELSPMEIPTGSKQLIKTECLKKPSLFTESTFDKAWQHARSKNVVKMADHEKFTHD